jgi:hypothetical protein
MTYSDWNSDPIDESIFKVPTSDPDFGHCKQCGVSPECPMEACEY